MKVSNFLFQMRQGPATKEAKELDERYYWTYVYMLQHGSTTVSTKPFNDPWDSGTAGIIFISKKMLIEMYYPDIKRQTKVEKKEKAAIKFFEQQVELLDDMFNGRCYGYTIFDETGEELESCWGYWGDSEYAENEGMDALNVLLEKYSKEKMGNPDPEVIITHRVREAIADLVAYCSDSREWEDWVEYGYSNNHIIHSAAVVKSHVLGDKSLQKEIDEETRLLKEELPDNSHE